MDGIGQGGVSALSINNQLVYARRITPAFPSPGKESHYPSYFLTIHNKKSRTKPGLYFEILNELLLLLINRVTGVFATQVDVVGQDLASLDFKEIQIFIFRFCFTFFQWFET